MVRVSSPDGYADIGITISSADSGLSPWDGGTGCSPGRSWVPSASGLSRACSRPARCKGWTRTRTWWTCCSASASIRHRARSNSRAGVEDDVRRRPATLRPRPGAIANPVAARKPGAGVRAEPQVNYGLLRPVTGRRPRSCRRCSVTAPERRSSIRVLSSRLPVSPSSAVILARRAAPALPTHTYRRPTGRDFLRRPVSRLVFGCFRRLGLAGGHGRPRHTGVPIEHSVALYDPPADRNT